MFQRQGCSVRFLSLRLILTSTIDIQETQASEYLVREDCSIAAGGMMPAPEYIQRCSSQPHVIQLYSTGQMLQATRLK